ncbi:MAG: RNA polymerase sigma factor (sigma-70 family) [Ilumatobacter sp.]
MLYGPIELANVVRDFARTLTTDFPIQGILDHLAGQIAEVLPVTGAGVTLISDGLKAQYVAASNDAALAFERLQSEHADGPCFLAYQSGESVAVPDLMVDNRFQVFGPAARAEGLAGVFTFPLRHGDRCIGALNLYRDTTGPLSVHETITAETMTDVVSACLINAAAREQADAASDTYQHDALHDPLTGLPNRALLMDRVHEANQRAKRSRLTTVVYFVELDRLTLINDHHGHHVGDALLIAVARRFTNMLRVEDTVAQVSGNEFVFLCEDLPDPAEAHTIGARIDEAFERPFVIDDLRLSMSANIGMVVAGPGEEVSAELIMHANTGTRWGTHTRIDHFRRHNTALFAQRSELKNRLALLTNDNDNDDDNANANTRNGNTGNVATRRRARILRRRIDDVTAQIVSSNVGLVRSYTRRFGGTASADERSDFESAGLLGLMRAVDSYDPESGGFGQWAFKPIQREVLRTVRDTDHQNISLGDFEKRPVIMRALRQLERTDESYRPSAEEVAALAGVTVAQATRVITPPQISSIDQSAAGADGTSLADLIESADCSPEATVISQLTVEALETFALQVLDPRARYVIVRRFGLDDEPSETLASIGKALGVSREAVRQIEVKALAKLQHSTLLRNLDDPGTEGPRPAPTTPQDRRVASPPRQQRRPS